MLQDIHRNNLSQKYGKLLYQKCCKCLTHVYILKCALWKFIGLVLTATAPAEHSFHTCALMQKHHKALRDSAKAAGASRNAGASLCAPAATQMPTEAIRSGTGLGRYGEEWKGVGDGGDGGGWIGPRKGQDL